MIEGIETVADSWTSYPKIYALGHPEAKMADPAACILEEKVDGSQFSFGVFDGELRCRSRNIQLHERGIEHDESNMFYQGYVTARDLAERGLLRDGYTYRGEFLKTQKQNTLKYDRHPDGHIILFDIATGHEEYMERGDLEKEAERIGLEVVPILHVGLPDSADTLLEIVNSSKSILGGPIEGVVIKARGSSMVHGRDGKPKYCKFVSEKFKEAHRSDWKERHPGKGSIAQIMAARHCTQARWEKTMFRLRDEGRLEQDPRDIGPILKAVQQDLEAEEAEVIKQELWNHYRKEILRHSTKGIPQWYKERLAKEALDAIGNA